MLKKVAQSEGRSQYNVFNEADVRLYLLFIYVLSDLVRLSLGKYKTRDGQGE